MEHSILDVMPPPPPTLDQIARERIRSWIQAREVKQTTLAPLIGKPQAWISRYLSGELGADLETLAAFARVFGHSLTALFDAPADPGEARVIDLYRRLPEPSRQLLVKLLDDWTHAKRGGPRNRKCGLGSTGAARPGVFGAHGSRDLRARSGRRGETRMQRP